VSKILERVNKTLDDLSDLAGAGIAGHRLEARVELLYLVGDILHDEKEDIRRTVLDEVEASVKRNYRQVARANILIERLRKGDRQ